MKHFKKSLRFAGYLKKYKNKTNLMHHDGLNENLQMKIPSNRLCYLKHMKYSVYDKYEMLRHHLIDFTMKVHLYLM